MPNRAITDTAVGGINSSYPTVAIHKGSNPQFNTSTTSKERLFGIAPPEGYYNGAPYVGCPAQTKTVNPSSSAQTVSADSGKVLESVTVNAVSNLSAGNIKKGTSVGGVAGTYTSDANAYASGILSGLTAYVNGSKITGTMANQGNWQGTKGIWVDANNHNLWVQFPVGAYLTEYETGKGRAVVGIPTTTRIVTPSTGTQTISTVTSDDKIYRTVTVNPIPNNRGQYQFGSNIGEGNDSSGDYYAINGLPEGYYVRNGAAWAPEARITKDKLRSHLGITPDKIRRGTSIAHVNGEVDRFIQYTGSVTSSKSPRAFDDMYGNRSTWPYVQLTLDKGFIPMGLAVFTNKREPYETITQDPWHIIRILAREGSVYMYDYDETVGISWGSTIRLPVTYAETQYDYVINGYNNS